ALASAAAMWRPNRALVPTLAMVVCLVLGIQLTRHTTQWLPAWGESATYSRQLFQLLRDGRYSSDDVVVVESAPSVPTFLWQWALPFAVQEPFMDLRARVVAAPDWYCCPEWQEKRE